MLVLTNGPAANVTAPADPRVGWQFVASNGPYTACARRVFASVQHVGGFVEPVYRGHLYHIERLIEPPGSDLRLLVVTEDLPAWAPIYRPNTNEWKTTLTNVWIVAGGAGTGQMVPPDYYWGGQESKRLRWSSSGDCYLVPANGYYVWRSDKAGAADGDSGYAVFTDDTQYIGPIQWGRNPVTVGLHQSGGILLANYLSWFPPDTAPPKPPEPKTPGPVSITVGP
jgi:hypothetical protein